ncbi:hypothetical protein [Paenibacillus sinensis]|nr:hypothetical protein [Paenibacillus sinensis]
MIAGCWGNSVAASAAPRISGYDTTDMYPVSGSAALLVDHAADTVMLADLPTGRFTKIPVSAAAVLDIKALRQPDKIILLQKSDINQVTKIVLSYQGRVLSRSWIPLKLADGDHVKWTAPAGKAKERIMVQNGNVFRLYQSPWRQPSVTYDAKLSDERFEYVSVIDWDFQGYPYLAVKYMAQGIMSEYYWVKTVNLYTKKETLFDDFITDVGVSLKGAKAEIYTSNVYDSVYNPVPANLVRPKAGDIQPYYQSVDIDRGKKANVLEGVFAANDDGGGWKTVLVNGRLFVGDLMQRSWSLYGEGGAVIVRNLSWPGEGAARFAGYAPERRIAYFLEYAAGKPSIAAVSIK